MFLSSCCNVSVTLPYRQLANILCLLDIGSGLNFILNDTAEKLKLKEIKSWSGTIATVNGETHGTHRVFLLPIEAANGQNHTVAALGIDHTGQKAPMPADLHRDIAKDFSINPDFIQNTAGNIQAILGLESQSMLATPTNMPRKANPRYPDVQLYQSILSPKYLAVGAAGPALTENKDVSTRMYHISHTSCNHTSFKPSSAPEIVGIHNHSLFNRQDYFQSQKDPELVQTTNMQTFGEVRTARVKHPRKKRRGYNCKKLTKSTKQRRKSDITECYSQP